MNMMLLVDNSWMFGTCVVFISFWDELRPEETQTGSEDLKSIFESHLVEAGRMLVLLETIEPESYSLLNSQ